VALHESGGRVEQQVRQFGALLVGLARNRVLDLLLAHESAARPLQLLAVGDEGDARQHVDGVHPRCPVNDGDRLHPEAVGHLRVLAARALLDHFRRHFPFPGLLFAAASEILVSSLGRRDHGRRYEAGQGEQKYGAQHIERSKNFKK